MKQCTGLLSKPISAEGKQLKNSKQGSVNQTAQWFRAVSYFADLISKVREWEDYYNYHRPQGALQGQTPFERLIEKSRADVSQRSLDSTQMLTWFRSQVN